MQEVPIMRYIAWTVSFLTVLLLAGCNGSGIITVAGTIDGPGSILSNTSAQFTYSTTADVNTVAWSVIPSSAGHFSNTDSIFTLFTAGPVTGIVQAEIKLTMDPDGANPAVLSLPVSIAPQSEANKPPMAIASAQPVALRPGGSVSLFNDSSDADGLNDLASWEWDLSCDPSIGFQADSTEWEPVLDVPDAGVIEVQLRVTDSTGQTDYLDEPLVIEATYDPVPPVAVGSVNYLEGVVNEPLSFTSDGSYDPDGDDLIAIEWDWNNDGAFDDIGAEIEHTWTVPGTFDVQMRVTDEHGEVDSLDRPISVLIRRPGWVYQYSSTYDPYGRSMVMDPGGNTYVIGTIESGDIVAVKLGSGGVENWAIIYSSVDSIRSMDVAVDQGGNVLLLGIRPEWTVHLEKASFIIWLDPDGQYTSHVTWNADLARSLAIDSAGNILIFGTFSGIVDFDPGTGETEVAERDAGIGEDGYLLKLGPTGEFIDVQTWGGDSFVESLDLNMDPLGNLYLTGSYRGSIDFDPRSIQTDIHTSNGQADVYLTKFNPAGEYLWTRTWGGELTDKGNSVASDDNGNLYVTGYFEDTADFDPGPGVEMHDSDGWKDVFLVAYTSSGNYQWARTWGSLQSEQWCSGNGVAAGPGGDVWVTGYYLRTVDFDPGLRTFLRTAVDESDIFLSRFDSSGNFIHASSWGGRYQDTGNALIIDDDGDVLITGGFSGSVDFNPGIWAGELVSYRFQDLFVLSVDTSD